MFALDDILLMVFSFLEEEITVNSYIRSENMDTMYSQVKSFMDGHPDVKSIRIEYSDLSYNVILSMRCLYKDSLRMMEVSKAIWYEDLPSLSENEHHGFMYVLSTMYDECQHVE